MSSNNGPFPTPPETNMSHLKIGRAPKRNVTIFQPSRASGAMPCWIRFRDLVGIFLGIVKLGYPGEEVIESKVIGSVGYNPKEYPIYK